VNAGVRTRSLAPGCRPQLREGVRLQDDRLSGRPVLLLPEGILQLNPTAAAVLLRCDGRHSVNEIVADLAATYEAPLEVLSADVDEYLVELFHRQLFDLVPGEAP
jgi:coenzyme PQQ biosynthesis protein PqqD